ncbi:ankyrin repeat-containing domain protein [Annulohypoxylon truncatum]|uniref:ankyrin repeat-containing domain protein n=1 Tax=Annulohypoxylon truncatum TaxID=327061 RepID=UPI002007D536|nr:ankyrin repeat-containing domain protein [Annulohypoxylon truncatum]KAI1209728.1 ankyrin repeat-containing domain protein [Annulohypoxylon truncatum]
MRHLVGSGKTMLISLVIDSLAKERECGKDTTCVYFYFQEGDKRHVSFACIWATLLIQLLWASSELKGELKTEFDYSLQGSTPLDSYAYLELFKSRAATVKTVYLVIDALDNCQNTPEEETQQKMRDALKALPDNIRVLFTSRDDSFDLGVAANRKLLITLKARDVETYVKKRIEDNNILRIVLKDDQKRKLVIDKVTAITLSSNMFLSARLYMDELSKRRIFADIKKALGELPDSAFKIFDESARQIAQKINLGSNDSKGCLIKHILTWVICAKTELTAEQICDSFAIQKSGGQPYQDNRPSEELLVPVCDGLVVMDPKNRILSLVHKSVQTYLQKHGIIPENADIEIAKKCLYCLLIDTDDQEVEPSLLQYAAKYWWAHLGCQGQADSEADSLALKFLGDSSKLARAFKAIEGTDNGAFDYMTGLHATVHFDLLSWAERLLREDTDINAQCSDGQTAVHWAVRYGRCKLLELFIDKLAELNIRDNAGDTPLHKALMRPSADKMPLHQAIMKSEADDENIVKALVAKGNARLDIGNTRGISPMLSAIRYGPTSIAKIMVESQKDVDAEIFDGWTSLRQVFYHGQDIVESGVASQGDRRAGVKGWAQLQHAVGNHARSLVDILLERGVNLNRPSAVDGWTPLEHAAKTGDLSKISRLLMRQPNPADVHLQDRQGKPPLWWAVSYKSAAAVQLLVKHGANVNEIYNDKSTPLSKSVQMKDSDMVQLLIRLGADVNMRIENGSTLLIEAIKHGDKDTAWMLLNANAALDETDMQHALELAIIYDNLSIAWLLYEHGASLSAANGTGSTPLHEAAKRRNYKAAQFLVERGGTIDTKDADGSTPLHYAVRVNHDDLTDLLASQMLRSSRKSGLDITDKQGNTALILAILNQRPVAVQSLLQYGASCNVADPKGLTALHHAAHLGFKEGLNQMVDKKFDGNPNATDNKGFTPLHHAVNGGGADPETVRILVRAGANMEAQDNDGRTPLMLAAQLGCEGLAHSLLCEGADAQTRNKTEHTAFSYAKNFPSIRRLLNEAHPSRKPPDYYGR